MAIQTYTFATAKNILTPVQAPQWALMDAAGFAASTTFVAGQALGRKTSDNLLYPLASGANDGTQTFVGFSAYSFKTDANSKCYMVTGSDSAVVHPYASPSSTMPIYVAGLFDPYDLFTSGTQTAEVDTFTPGGTIATGDVNKVTYTAPDLSTQVATFTTGATTTAAAVSAGLIAAWNANPTLTALGTASGTNTFVVTATQAANPLSLASSVTGVGTLTKATTTAAAGRTFSDIQGGAPGARILHNGYWLV